MVETRDWLALSLAPGLGPVGFWSLVEYFGSPSAVLEADFRQRRQVPGIRQNQLAALGDSAGLRRAAASETQRLAAADCRIIVCAEPAYPEQLRQTACPPPVLFCRGRIELLTAPAVAVIGSRAATSYGRRVAFNLARDLAGSGVMVVSGLALGIDAEAHSGSLAAGGATIAVLGCGLDVIYPAANRRLFESIVDRGLIISEYPLATKPEGFRFPARNRIIAGMSRGVVVVEAARRSGSLITVHHALDEGREVFAIPGQIDSVKSSGTHWLLQQGATLALSAEDIIEHLQLERTGRRKPAEGEAPQAEIGADAAALLELLEPYPLSRHTLLERSKLPAAKLSELLLLLELEGMIKLLPGDAIRKIS